MVIVYSFQFMKKYVRRMSYSIVPNMRLLQCMDKKNV